MVDRQAQTKATKSTKWAEGVSATARVLPTLYPVFVHGVRCTNVKTADQKRAIRLIQEQNVVLHLRLKVKKVS